MRTNARADVYQAIIRAFGQWCGAMNFGRHMMTRKTSLIVVLTGLAVSGCAPGRFGEGTEPTQQICSTPSCQIEVTVTGTPPALSAVRELLVTPGNHGPGGVVIVWHLPGPNASKYEFRDDSIQFYDPASGSQFHDNGASGAGAEYHWTDRHTDVKRYGYMIKVYDRATGIWYPLDPWIVNQ